MDVEDLAEGTEIGRALKRDMPFGVWDCGTVHSDMIGGVEALEYVLEVHGHVFLRLHVARSKCDGRYLLVSIVESVLGLEARTYPLKDGVYEAVKAFRSLGVTLAGC